MSAEARIGYIPGNNIGPVLTFDAALPVARKAAEMSGMELDFVHIVAGSEAYDATGGREYLPDSSMELIGEMDALLKAPIGGPPNSDEEKWQGIEVATILPIRKQFTDANLRPLKVLGEIGVQLSPLPDERVRGLDAMIVRELTGDLYFGKKRSGTSPSGERYAYETNYYTESQVEEVVKKAIAIAQERGEGLSWVHKTNVLPETGGLWKDVFERLTTEAGMQDTGYMHVDAMAAALIKRPNTLGTVVMPNMFGDILTDEGAEILGSVGLGPSASLGKDNFGLYEPMGGAAWDINPADANPVGMILSVAMMFRHSFNMPETADAIEYAVQSVLNEYFLTNDLLTTGKKRFGGIIGKQVNAAEFTALVLEKMDETAG